MYYFVSGHIHHSSRQLHICPDFITGRARAIKEASVNLITVPSLTTGSIAYPKRGGKVLPQICDPRNDVVLAADIDVAFKSYSGER